MNTKPQNKLLIVDFSQKISSLLGKQGLKNGFHILSVSEDWEFEPSFDVLSPSTILLHIDENWSDLKKILNNHRRKFFDKKIYLIWKNQIYLRKAQEDLDLLGLPISYKKNAEEVQENVAKFFQTIRDNFNSLTVFDLKEAIDKKQIISFFQPKIDLESHQMIGAEVLMRWQHPQKGLIQPIGFLHLLEEGHLHQELTLCLFKQVLRQFHIWKRHGILKHISLNVPANCFSQPDFYQKIDDICKELDLDPTGICFEVTEQNAMANLDKVTNELKDLVKKGISLSIDDFGTGHSSLLRLMDLPFSEIKIEYAMTSKLLTDMKTQMILEVIFDLAQKMKLKICAEGIENVETEQKLKEMGCHIGQGYLYSVPLSVDGFENWYKENYAPNLVVNYSPEVS